MAELKSFTFIVPGKPQGKERPRSGRNGHFYTPKKSHMYEDLVRYNAKEEYSKVYENTRPLECAVSVDIVAVYEIPKSYPKKRKEACMSGQELPTKKPDSDNIIKSILDGMNPKKKHKLMLIEGIYKDDSQVTACSLKKEYGANPEVRVRVSWYD
ncbi:Holliday junction resolvase RusA-like endonuclease [Lactobacillus colini]|uniref:Holliday junction resolvase RusA-like endonuclease n=1 Tax=Lactobacillus colini TaxID=1819254 RepID=A0ABS4MG03_9LACO|nr:RusA family crossover junction endodeoxyribonuclease [Lactobacillus colini]MBP2058614.1 Holliday junction resolvase RusA-like endonuclease [Lactobacillus colini]